MVRRRRAPKSPANQMKVLDVQKSGKRGTIVRYTCRYGEIERQLVVPRDPRTPVQEERRKAFGRARYLWGKLTDEQHLAWNVRGEEAPARVRLEQSYRLSGYLLCVQINCNLAEIGLPMVCDPPELPRFGKNPVRQFSITRNQRAVALNLRVVGDPEQDILVSATRPHSAGTSYVDHFVFLGLLPVPSRGVSDIAELYAAKFGAPPIGSRVFVETVQQVDGWRDSPQRASAIVCAA